MYPFEVSRWKWTFHILYATLLTVIQAHDMAPGEMEGVLYCILGLHSTLLYSAYTLYLNGTMAEGSEEQLYFFKVFIEAFCFHSDRSDQREAGKY